MRMYDYIFLNLCFQTNGNEKEFMITIGNSKQNIVKNII